VTQEFIPFDLERMMSIFEYQVDYNLSESGVHPLTTQDLIRDTRVIEELLSTELNYPQTNGTMELRESIAATYENATADNVIVTTGAAQANFTTIWTLLEPGDEILVMLPNYMQIWGIAKNFNLNVNTFYLKEDLDWHIDLDELKKSVSDKTKLIAVCNPNNPTGHIMTDEERKTVIELASKHGAWLLSDEVYSGAERMTEVKTSSFWNQYERTLAIGSMSKAYGLPGLRIGWVVAPPSIIQDIWARQDYVTIGASMLANKIATYALQPETRMHLINRTRKYIREGYKNFEAWYKTSPEIFSCVPPQALAVALLRYNAPINSTALCEKLISEASTYVVPGNHFGLDKHLRISFGLPKDFLNEGLARIERTVKSVIK